MSCYFTYAKTCFLLAPPTLTESPAFFLVCVCLYCTHTHTYSTPSTHRGPGWSPSSVTVSRRPASVPSVAPRCGARWSNTGRTSAADLCSSGKESLRWAGAVWPALASVSGTARVPRRGRSRKCPCCRSCTLLLWFCSGRSWRSRCRGALAPRTWQILLLCRWG